MSREAAKMNSTSGVAFLINLFDDTKLPKFSPRTLNSKMEDCQTHIVRHALSPDLRSRYY